MRWFAEVWISLHGAEDHVGARHDEQDGGIPNLEFDSLAGDGRGDEGDSRPNSVGRGDVVQEEIPSEVVEVVLTESAGLT